VNRDGKKKDEKADDQSDNVHFLSELFITQQLEEVKRNDPRRLLRALAKQ
jgi:hypothetical protein